MKPLPRRAEWIWRRRGLDKLAFADSTPPYANEANRYIYFRKTFDLSGEVERAPIHVSADGRYQLFVNGNFVGRGPARCNPNFQTADPYDLASHLKPGRNVIAALVHSFGRNTSFYELPVWEQARAFGCGGFFLQGDATTHAGALVRLDTDASWRYCEANAWQRDAPFGSLGFVEIYAAHRAPADWSALDFDDLTWDTAQVLRVLGRNTTADVVPFPILIPRAIPPMREALQLPRAIARVGEVVNAPASREIADLSAHEAIGELTHCRARNVEALLQAEGAAEIITTPEHSVSIVLDFGDVVAGYVHLELDGSEGAIVDFTYDERLEADGRVRLAEGIPGFDARPGHRYILREGKQTWERFGWNGFRYLQATFRNCVRPLRVHTLAINATGYPVEARGAFECSDEVLNRLWRAGAYTERLSMHDAFVDCPSREQRQWVCDSYIQPLINYAAFGDTKLTAQFLRQAAQSQRGNGLTMMVAPGDFSAASFTNIPDYCLYWIMAIGSYVEYTGDTEIVSELYPSVVKALAWFDYFVNEDDLLTDVPHWVFIDWAELDKTGQVTALNAHWVTTLRVAAKLARIVGTQRDAVRFEAIASRVADAINRWMWDDARGIYVDARNQGKLSRRVSQQSNAAVIAFDIAPRERWSRIFAAILDESRLVLTRGIGADYGAPPMFDEERNVVLAQPFYMHHLHRALSRAGMFDALLDNIRKHWPPMVADGSNTFWEGWQLTPITSKSHAFCATPTFDLSTEVLGIAPLEPGFARFRVAPRPANLEWARGIFPSPRGDIRVSWKRDANRFELSLDVPAETRAEIELPVRGTIRVDGDMARQDALVVGAGAHQIVVEEILDATR